MQRSQSTDSCIRHTHGIILGAVAALGVATLVSYFALDQWVISALLRSPIDWDAGAPVRAFTRLGKGWLQVWLLLAWLLNGRRRRDVLVALAALALVGASVSVLKLAVMRPRPYETVKAQPAHHTGDMSFPSGDTATAVAITAAILPAVSGPARYLLPAACVGIAWLRIAGMAHYPSDVLAGVAIGLLCGWLTRRLIVKQPWLERDLPLERWLVLGGIVGIPASIAFSNGFAEEALFLNAYGIPVLGLLIAGRVGRAMRAAPERVLSFLTRWQFPALMLTFAVIVAGDIVTGDKPHELLPSDGQSASPIAVLGLLLVIAGVLIRLSVRAVSEPADRSPPGLPATAPRGMTFGMLLVMCGLLCQLQNFINWLGLLPVFALFYGVPMLGKDLTLSRMRDRQWWSTCVRPVLTRPFTGPQPLLHWLQPRCWRPHIRMRDLCATLALLLLPFAIEILVEDLLFESWLHL